MENIINGRYYDLELTTMSYSILYPPMLAHNVPAAYKLSMEEVDKITERFYVEDSDSLSLKDMYIFREKDIVQEYLNSKEFLKQILAETFEKIQGYFYNPSLFLEVISNPEEDDDTHLALFIKTSLPPTEAVEKLDQLDEEWISVFSADIAKHLSINLEF